MKFVRNDDACIIGSSRVGETNATYEHLCAVFGDPMQCDEDLGDGKITLQWVVEFQNGIIATIYDYCGFEWSIGGWNNEAANLVHDALKNKSN